MAGNFLLSYIRTLKVQQYKQEQISRIDLTLTMIEFESINKYKFLWNNKFS